MLLTLKRWRAGAVAVMAMLSIPVAGQDLIASQAPIDKKLRAVDSVALQRLISDEQLQNPAFALYPDWNNHNVRYANMTLPEEFKIDLRHFHMPTDSRLVTSKFGYRASFRRMHEGLDVKVYIGDTIRAAFDGKVRIVKNNASGWGKYVVLRHPNGLETLYGHLSKQLVKEDAIVKAGDPIGLGGNTGRSRGSHLHLETRFMGVPINPAEMFDFENQDVTGDYYIYRSNGKSTVLVSKAEADGTLAYEEVTPKAQIPQSKSSVARNAPRGAGKVHKVRSGESLSVIARKYGTTVDKLCRLNGISPKTMLRPGRILRCS